MKKILCILICLLAFKVWAQTESGELFDFSNESLFGSSTKQTFTGKPVVLIEKKSSEPDEVNKAELLPPLDLEKNVLNIPIKTFFGHNRTAAFIDHTTDFVSIIQVLDDETVHVTEQIQFITTKDGEKFKRFFPNKINDINGDNIPIQIEVLSIKRDSSVANFILNTYPNGTEITLDTPLPKGVHRMILKYRVHNPFKINQSLAEMLLPITDPGWGQMTERMATVIMMPKKSHFYEKEFLFGINNQKIPENTKISEDQTGVLTFQNTHPLPAFADIRLHLIMDAKDLTKAPQEGNLNLMVIGYFTLILAGYVILSILTARFKKWKRPLTESKKINSILWATEIKEELSAHQVALLSDSGFKRAHDEWWVKIATFFRFNSEYVAGVIVLILLTKYIIAYNEAEVSNVVYGVLILLALAGILLIDYYGTRVQMKHLRDILKNILLNDPQGLNLAKREIPTYYQMAVCFNFHEVWKNRLVANNPSYRDLTCFTKEK